MVTKNNKLRKNPSSSRYPWTSWFLKPRFVLKRNRDFYGQVHGMAMTARHAAKRFNVSISVHVKDDTVTITVHKT